MKRPLYFLFSSKGDDTIDFKGFSSNKKDQDLWVDIHYRTTARGDILNLPDFGGPYGELVAGRIALKTYNKTIKNTYITAKGKNIK